MDICISWYAYYNNSIILLYIIIIAVTTRDNIRIIIMHAHTVLNLIPVHNHYATGIMAAGPEHQALSFILSLISATMSCLL